ncbi:MAG: acyl carrier protein [Muribaculaceae bacterium]|nr:acyl carrier protein [Muribaculaceae bacterium]
MEIKSFIDRFAEIFDDTDASVLTPETNFRELEEWSSLCALEVMAIADEEFGVELSANDIRKANTIQELYNLIVKE